MSDPTMHGIPAIGPGASKRPHGAYIAEQGRKRKGPRVAYRKVWCGNRPDGHGGEDA